MTVMTVLINSISWITTSDPTLARIIEGDGKRELTPVEWDMKMPVSAGAFIVSQPHAYLVGDKAYGRSTEMASQSTVRQILEQVSEMTTSDGPKRMEDHVYFEGVCEDMIDGRLVLTVQTGS